MGFRAPTVSGFFLSCRVIMLTHIAPYGAAVRLCGWVLEYRARTRCVVSAVDRLSYGELQKGALNDIGHR